MLSIKHRLLLSHLFVALFGVGALAVWLYSAAERELVDGTQARLLGTARVLATNFTAAEFNGPAAGRASEQELRQRLLTAVQATPDAALAFVVMRRYDGMHRIAMSSAPAPELSTLERAVDDAALATLLHEGFAHAVAGPVSLGGEGTWIALAPVGGSGEYAVGLQTQPGVIAERLRTLRLSTALALLACVLAALVLSRIITQRFHARMNSLIVRCRALANGEPLPKPEGRDADEVAAVLGEFDAMAERLRATQAGREQALDALTEANRTLESRVRERTAALEAATQKLKSEIEGRLEVEALLAEAALTDPLTSLLNRRAMVEMLHQIVQPGTGAVPGFSAILADIDHFKRINDRYGHEAGDAVLKAVARVLDAIQDEQRHTARWGGEEFLLLCPQLRLAEACRRAEDVRRRIGEMTLDIPGLHVTVSLGVAEFVPGEPLEDCLRRCDQALYRAKDSGRNTVVAAQGGMFANLS